MEVTVFDNEEQCLSLSSMELDFSGLKSNNPMIEGNLEPREVERLDFVAGVKDLKACEKLAAVRVLNYRHLTDIVNSVFMGFRSRGSLDFEFKKRLSRHEQTGHSGRVADLALKIAAGEA